MNLTHPYVVQTVDVSGTCTLTVVCFCSLLRYTPNPGGGPRTRQSCAAPGKGRKTSCSICSNSGLPIVDEICPFHERQTEGLVTCARSSSCSVVFLASKHVRFCFVLILICLLRKHVIVYCAVASVFRVIVSGVMYTRQPCSVGVFL